MRLAQFRLPRVESDSEDGVLTVSSVGGAVEDNIVRWEGQFEATGKAVVKEEAVGELSVTLVAIEGPFQSRPDYILHAAIVQAPGGQLFFKGWGPRATMERWKPSFDKMVQSLRKDEGSK
jgi:hypothetical protein